MAAEGRDPEPKKKRKASGTKKNKIQDKEKEKPAKKMKPRNEIDDIFEEFQKKKKVKMEEEKTSPETEIFGSIQKKKKKKNNEGDTEKRNRFGVSPLSRGGERENKKPRRKTGDGLPIYSAEELGVSNPNAGGTSRCPFDCSCCF